MTEQNTQRIHELNQAAHDVKEKQEKSLVIDFDKAAPPEEVTIKFNGKEFTTLSEPGAKVELFFLRHDKELPDEKVVELLELIFGTEFFEEIKESGRSLRVVAEHILVPLMTMWGYQGSNFIEEQEEKKDQATQES